MSGASAHCRQLTGSGWSPAKSFSISLACPRLLGRLKRGWTRAGQDNPRSPPGPNSSPANQPQLPAPLQSIQSSGNGVDPRSAFACHRASGRLNPRFAKVSVSANRFSVSGYSLARRQRLSTFGITIAARSGDPAASLSRMAKTCRKPYPAPDRHCHADQRAITGRLVDRDRADLDGIISDVAQQLRPVVEVHRPGVLQRAG